MPFLGFTTAPLQESKSSFLFPCWSMRVCFCLFKKGQRECTGIGLLLVVVERFESEWSAGRGRACSILSCNLQACTSILHCQFSSLVHPWGVTLFMRTWECENSRLSFFWRGSFTNPTGTSTVANLLWPLGVSR
jgi:hypothetical protein